MAEELRYLSSIVRERARQVLTALPSSDGHGSSLTRAVKVVAERLAERAEQLATGGPYSPLDERVHVRELQRSDQQINVLYRAVSMYGSDVGRSDVPIGLLHLVDELIQDLLPSGADSLLHLDTLPMYRTVSIFHQIPGTLDPNEFPEPHPVAFYVPGLQPANALFAPILAHEVGHTCWQRGMGHDLQAMLDVPAIQAALSTAVAAGADAVQVRDFFAGWMTELMCDALAATLAGPAFLFASVVFLPVVAQPQINTHPYPRDRLAFTLRVLERHSWTSVLRDEVPGVFAWCENLAANPLLSNSPMETALRDAVALIEPAMMELADRVAANRVTYQQFLEARDNLYAHLSLEVPPVATRDSNLSAWLLITATWLHEIRQRGSDQPGELPGIAIDPRLNRFVLKAIELSGIVRLWSHDGATSP